ncbi:unnamed protein product [Gordionus sp. m RMFG-2023]
MEQFFNSSLSSDNLSGHNPVKYYKNLNEIFNIFMQSKDIDYEQQKFNMVIPLQIYSRIFSFVILSCQPSTHTISIYTCRGRCFWARRNGIFFDFYFFIINLDFLNEKISIQINEKNFNDMNQCSVIDKSKLYRIILLKSLFRKTIEMKSYSLKEYAGEHILLDIDIHDMTNFMAAIFVYYDKQLDLFISFLKKALKIFGKDIITYFGIVAYTYSLYGDDIVTWVEFTYESMEHFNYDGLEFLKFWVFVKESIGDNHKYFIFSSIKILEYLPSNWFDSLTLISIFCEIYKTNPQSIKCLIKALLNSHIITDPL